jgi:hypothetical protein
MWGAGGTEDSGTDSRVQKVYLTDQHILEFPAQSNHPLATDAQEPFLTPGLRTDFRLQLYGGVDKAPCQGDGQEGSPLAAASERFYCLEFSDRDRSHGIPY